VTTSGSQESGPVSSQKTFAEGIFRSNPDYQLVLLDSLPADDQKAFAALRRDRNFYGLLRPIREAPGLTVKAVCRQTADLFSSLGNPGELPSSPPRDSFFLASVLRMVYDGILQVRQGEDWNCGFAAWFHHAHVNDVPPSFEEPDGILAALSLRAVRHAETFQIFDVMELSDVLYRYNSLPFTASWAQRIPDRETLVEFLGIQSGGRLRRNLDRDWSPVRSKENPSEWLSWEAREIATTTKSRSGYKLYLSPRPAHLRAAFEVFHPAITAAGAHNFKIGGNVRAVLRPDKLVAYFHERAALDEAASLIAKQLAGCPAQGVPFTAEFSAGSLVSWASDPPELDSDPAWIRRQSWRTWICSHLASALVMAKAAQKINQKTGRETDTAAWLFALDRLRLEGVDTSTWTLSTSWESNPAFQ
jgi:hypothetical protein